VRDYYPYSRKEHDFINKYSAQAIRVRAEMNKLSEIVEGYIRTSMKRRRKHDGDIKKDIA